MSHIHAYLGEILRLQFALLFHITSQTISSKGYFRGKRVDSMVKSFRQLKRVLKRFPGRSIKKMAKCYRSIGLTAIAFEERDERNLTKKNQSL